MRRWLLDATFALLYPGPQVPAYCKMFRGFYRRDRRHFSPIGLRLFWLRFSSSHTNRSAI
jgi:hypothetical protein